MTAPTLAARVAELDAQADVVREQTDFYWVTEEEGRWNEMALALARPMGEALREAAELIRAIDRGDILGLDTDATEALQDAHEWLARHGFDLAPGEQGWA